MISGRAAFPSVSCRVLGYLLRRWRDLGKALVGLRDIGHGSGQRGHLGYPGRVGYRI